MFKINIMNYQKPTKKPYDVFMIKKVWYVFNMSQKTTIKVKKKMKQKHFKK